MERAALLRATSSLCLLGTMVIVNGRVGKPCAEQKCGLAELRRAHGSRPKRPAQPLDEIHQHPRAGPELRPLSGLRVESDAWLGQRSAARGLDTETREPHEGWRARQLCFGNDGSVPKQSEEVQEASPQPCNPKSDGQATDALATGNLLHRLAPKHSPSGSERDLNPSHLARQSIAGKCPFSCAAVRADSKRDAEHHELRPSMELPRNATP